MAIENKLAKLMRNSGPARFFVPVGIILIVFGIFMSGFNFDKYVETTGKVTSVYEGVDTENNKVYDVEFTYTADGKELKGAFVNMTQEYKVGETVTVFYDPDDPGSITNSKMSSLTAPIMIGVGAIALVFGIWKTIQAFKKSKELEQTAPGKGLPEIDFAEFKTSPGVTEYYCRHDGNALKPGYILEDAGRNVLFEAKMLKNNPLGARSFEFTDHTNGYTQQHEVGHVMTQSYNDEFFSMKSWFKFDGQNIWDLLHARGLRLDTDLRSKFPNIGYNVSKDGAAFARIETSGKYVHEDEAEQHSLNIPVGRYYYRIWTNANDFETLFLTVFAVSESEQTMVE